jgi:pentose-5-phosphate-3-epimerase
MVNKIQRYFDGIDSIYLLSVSPKFDSQSRNFQVSKARTGNYSVKQKGSDGVSPHAPCCHCQDL